jgi:adenylate kinase
MWRHMTTRTSTAGDVAKYLSGCIDQELPQLVKDRHVFAFTNGTYVTCCQRPDGTIGDVFVPYNQQQEDGLHLGEGIAAANFFEVQLEYMDHCKWVDIPTPNLDRILNTQQLKPEVMRWMYVFIGRLLYALNEKDKWQVIPFLKGVGGCGKSTLINDVCGQLYFHTDTGNLSNNIEKRFGLSALVDKLVYLAAEIKNDFQLEQAEFQQMVSGDEVTINIKHQTARSVAWRIPGMLAGNELPGWVDNSSSIARRVVIFYFPHHVANEKGDSDLGTKLRAELGNIIQKCNRAYLQAVHQVGTDNVWMHLPKYFKDQQQVLRMETNSMEHYLASNLLVFGPDKYIPYCAFQVKYKDYCRVNSLTMKAFNNTNMDTTFSRYSLHKGTHVESMRYPPNSATTLETTFLHGVDEVPTNVTIDDEAGMAF